MIQQSEIVEKRAQHAVRASHAKSSACVVGTLTIADDLPPESAHGLFAPPGTCDVAIRFSQGPGETLGDRVSTHRGMAIKVFGVKGEKLPGHGAPTQDFVLATGRTFPSGTASGFLSDAKKIGKASPLPEGVKSAVSSAARVGDARTAAGLSCAVRLSARTGLLKKTPLTSPPSRPEPKQESLIMPTAVNTATYAAVPIGTVSTTLTINGETRTRAIEPWTTLLDLLREGEDLIGTKKGCDHGQCGACTVLVDGRRINSCLKLAVTLDGAEITTIEGLGQPGNLHPLQSAFCDHDAFQCGYCTPGQICSAQGLINEGKARTREEVRELMSGNLCRCGAYTNIIDAVLDVIGEQA